MTINRSLRSSVDHLSQSRLSCISTWHPKYPRSGVQCSLEVDIQHAGVAGIAFDLSILIQHKWNSQADLRSSIADEDLLSLYKNRNVVESTLYAMGLDPTRLPSKTDPG